MSSLQSVPPAASLVYRPRSFFEPLNIGEMFAKAQPLQVEIGAGDNRGRTVRQVNVVRAVRVLGAWTGRPGLYRLPPGVGEDEAVAVLVQARADRRILNGAVRTPH